MTQMSQGTRSVSQSPVSDVTYNLMQALTSKLEAIEAYQKYTKDAQGHTRQLFDELLEEDRRQAERLLEALREELR
jgi:HPt (histidine-containing phosphotransfer) domain-containing protein